MHPIRRLDISPPLINSSCAWASELDQLQDLFDSPHTGAVTTRTATLTGYNETSDNTVAFANDTITTLNSYGYSPHPLSCYVDYVETILTNAPRGSTKPIIISITSSSPFSLATMLDNIQDLRRKLQDTSGALSRIAVELNTSCPNIKGSPPPAYNFPCLAPILDVLARYFWDDPTLVLGLKLPPYVYSTQFDDIIKGIAAYSRPDPGDRERDRTHARRLNPFAFFTSTNTLGSALMFPEQTSTPGLATAESKNSDPVSTPPTPSDYALPTVLGALAGEALHPLALGNVYTLSQALKEHEDQAMRAIAVIGVGGVTTKDAHRRMRRAGAKVVACATLLGRQGVKAFEAVSVEDDDEERTLVEEKGGGKE
ncbi:FMN-linked oxidoreductase [Dentipellis sp. KUC8613]|nr:FMN-linked oxidoreductase [Dentipellis sp. KUC8613]